MPQIHLIGNAHLDPVWLWRWQEGFSEVKATFRSALDRMNEFPGFVFTCAGACCYQWVEENEPAMFEEIGRRVAEGRWVVAGGWWLQADCNIPSGESFVRQGLYAQRYFLQKFGRIATFGYAVDSFGHNAMLPQLLKKSGMEHYVMRRPEADEKELPANVFWWRSADGSRVLTYRIPLSYCSDENRGALLSKYRGIQRLCAEQGTPMMLFYGVGNHGGGPTASTLRMLEEWMAQGTGEAVYSSPEAFFAELKGNGMEYPVVEDELQRHAVGCYSAVSEVKSNNRKAEGLLAAAEKAMVLAHCLLQLPYDGRGIERAWKCVLFNQFHDILGGCCIREAYVDARDFHGEALKAAQEILNGALQKISWAIDTSRGMGILPGKNIAYLLWEHAVCGAPVVAFNTLSWDVHTAIPLNKDIKRLEDENGNELSIQPVRASRTKEGDKWDTLFQAVIPALGYRVFWAHTRGETAKRENALRTAGHMLENEFLRLNADAGRGYVQLYDKTNGSDVFDGWGAVPVVLEDMGDTWAHGIQAFREEIGRFGNAAVSLIESGPVRATLRVVSHYGRSALQQDFSVYKGSPAVEVRVRLNWQEERRILKLSFPVNVREAEATYEIPYGAIRRGTDGLEYPGQSWVDVTGRSASGEIRGLALANDSKYSYDALGGDLRMTVVRSAVYADHFGERDAFCECMDQGVQYMRYLLLPHRGPWRESGIVKRAEELLNPVATVWETYHDGTLPQRARHIDISRDNVVAAALKQEEDGEGLILRCRETHGVPTAAHIRLVFAGREWDARFSPYEIKTFLIRKGRPVRETDLIERSLPAAKQRFAKRPEGTSRMVL